jgi:hypothetical protein
MLIYIKEVRAISVKGHGGLWGCEMLRIPHCLYSRLTDSGKVVSPTHPIYIKQKQKNTQWPESASDSRSAKLVLTFADGGESLSVADPLRP